MLLTQQQFAPLFRLGLREDFQDSFENWESEYPFFLKSGDMSRPEIQAAMITGLSRLIELGDGEPVTFDTPRLSDVVMGIDREWGIGFALTRKTVEDDQYNKANQAAKWLGNAVNQTYEYRAASLLDDAFAGATYKGIDNKSLCNTAHTLFGNSLVTVANAPSTAVGLSVTGITALMDMAGNMKDENGDPTKMWPTKFLIGNDATNINKAHQIFGSEKEPFTAENQDNAIKKRFPSVTWKPMHYMTNTKWYFGVDEKYNDAWILTRRKPTYEDDVDFPTGAMLSKVTCRFLIWFVSWHGWVGVNATS
jgi:hypothetical protein